MDEEDEFYQAFNVGAPAPRPTKKAKDEAGKAQDSEVIDITADEVREFNERLKERIRAKNEIKEPMDTVKLGEGVPTHWKQRYYFEKFRIKQTDMVDFLQRIKKAYIEGVCWVMLYYYQGCASWTWFYPYHYAPFASDLVGCSMLKAGNKGYFTRGEPFVPFEQLMS